MVFVLGLRIASLRRQAHLSQAELAQRLKISASAIGMYEQGRREPSGEMLVAIARELHVTTDYLLTGHPQTVPEAEALTHCLLSGIDGADLRLKHRPERPFSRQELAVLFAALLMEP